jgi:YD repeat-containing protein
VLVCSRAVYRDCHQRYQIDYDPLYRLTDLSQGSSVLEHFDYDATGNRTAANIGGAAQSYAYPANSHRLQSVNGTSRDYDNAGNTTWSEGLKYQYNGRNRLASANMGRTTYYAATYNARGEREEKVLMMGATTQRFIYDEAGHLIQIGNVPQNKSMPPLSCS